MAPLHLGMMASSPMQALVVGRKTIYSFLGQLASSGGGHLLAP